MAKHLRFLSALLICVFLLAGCGAKKSAVCKDITCQDVIRAYSAYEQYQVVHQEYTASEPLLCFVRVDAPDGDYAYFTFYDTPEHAQEDYRPYNMVTWLFALILGEARWLHTDIYQNICCESFDREMLTPFYDLLRP